MKKVTSLLLVALLFTGCAERVNKEQIGGMSGAILGGIAGSNVGAGQGRTAAIIAGTLLGAFVGKSVGSSLDKADLMYAERAQAQAYNAPLNESISWNNPETGHAGTITPTREGTSSAGAYCREFQQTVTIGGQTEQAYGIACQQPDGSWRITND